MLSNDASIIGVTSLATKACRRKNSEQIQKINPDFPKWASWQRKLDRIKKELRMLYFAKGMFERLNNRFKNQNSLVSIHLQNTYIVYLAMGIRRLIDKISKTRNLYQILENIKENASQISVENHAQYMFIRHEEYINHSSAETTRQKKILIESRRKDELKLARRAFREALGNRIQNLRCCDVEKDICKIKDIRERIGKLADKRWAHMDGGKPPEIKFREAHKDFSLLISICNKYSLLIEVPELELDDNTFFSGWDKPFRSLR
jgi:hypothetical protein